MSNTNKRIIDLEAKQTLGSGDYLAADSEQGTYKVDANTNIMIPLTNLNSEISDIVNVYGAKNLLPYPYDDTTKTTNGITYTDNGDGTIKINGTCVNASAWFYIRPQGLLKDVTDIKTPGTYIFSRGTDALDTLQYYRIYDITAGADLTGADRGNLTFTVTEEQLTHTVTVGCWIKVGKTVNNIVMKPMIRLASIEDDTYVPYAKSNKELTDDIIPLNNSVADSNDAYDSTKAYVVGDLVIYNNKLYRCKTACSAASWDVNSTNFEETTLTKVATQLNSELTKLNINTLGSAITLTKNTDYITQYDGYVVLQLWSENNKWIAINVNTVKMASIVVGSNAASGTMHTSVFVKAGSTIKHDTNSTSSDTNAKFYPLKN